MPEEVLDLDILRPEKKIVRLAGKEIDVSFIPCGLTWDIDKIARQLYELDRAKAEEGTTEETKRAFDLTVDLCVTFCQWKHKEMTREWFVENVDIMQLERLAATISSTLERSYAGAEAYQKN